MRKNNWWKKEDSVLSEKMHSGIFEGVHVTDVPLDYLMFVIKCSKQDSNNPNTLIARKYLDLNGYEDFRKNAIDFKTRMILSEYEFEKKCIETDTFYFNKEHNFKIFTKNGRVNKPVIQSLTAYSSDVDFDENLGITREKNIVYIDLIARVIKYGLKARTLTLNTIVSRNILNRLNNDDTYYTLRELSYDKIFEILSSPQYADYILVFYMRYKEQIKNNTQYSF